MFEEKGSPANLGSNLMTSSERIFTLNCFVRWKEICSGIMEQSLTILSLPNEILEIIIKQMPRMDRRALRPACKRMDAQVMRYFHLHPELNDANMEPVLRIQQPFSKLRVSDLTSSRAYFVRGLSKIADTTTRLTIHHNIETGRVISLLNCTRIFRICSNVTQLSLSGTILNILQIPLDFFVSISHTLTHLKELKLGFGGVGDRGLVLSALTLAKFPKLESFSIWVGSWGQLKLTRLEYSKITEFIAMHWATLKFLVIDDQGNHCWSRFGDNIVPTSPRILEHLGKIQLESLEWYNSFLTIIHLVPLWTAAPDLIKGQKQLKKMQFDFPVDHLMESIRMAIDGSSETLECLSFQFHPRTITPFDCHILSECHNLKKMFLSHPAVVINIDQLPNSIEDLHWDSPITPREAWLFEQQLVNLTCLRLGDRSGGPLQDTVQQIFRIPKLKTIRLCSFTNVALRGLITEAAVHFVPPANISYHTHYNIINGVVVISD